MYAYCLLQTI